MTRVGSQRHSKINNIYIYIYIYIYLCYRFTKKKGILEFVLWPFSDLVGRCVYKILSTEIIGEFEKTLTVVGRM